MKPKIKNFNNFINETFNNEIIENIEEWKGKIPYSWIDKQGKKQIFPDYGINVSGYILKTNKKEYKFVIENEQKCCEIFGYFTSEDNTDDFIGTKLINIEIVNTALNVSELKINEILKNRGIEDGDTMFVNINTSEGMLQLVAYNSQNGNYGHKAYFMVDNIVEKEKGL